MHWGHAASADLIHWEHLPVALAPDRDGPDADGCYSGVAVVHEGVPTLVYTGVRQANKLPCLATSTNDDLRHWVKDPANPVISGTPQGVATTIFRDPTLWREGDEWLMGVGAGIEGGGGAVLLYRSRDLRHWEYLHPLLNEPAALNLGGGLVSTGWECPDVFFVDDRPVLVACEWDIDPIAVSYWTGRYEDRQLHADRKGVVDAGPCFYAPQPFADDRGRRVMLGWLRERRADEALVDAGWAGAMSLPRQVALNEDGTLAFAPVEELALLRSREIERPLCPGPVNLDGIPGDVCEIVVRTDDAPAGAVVLEVLRSPDGVERTTIRFDPAEGTVTVDTTKASSDPLAFVEVVRSMVPGADGEPLMMRVFVDRSIVELFVNDRVAVSVRLTRRSRVRAGSW